jgi:predicted acylesterase/phospholipase RssA
MTDERHLDGGSAPPGDDRGFCDVVMKGGVTSGIVYPAAICEIAKTFTFKNIGGTSAGAIAAALTAAAQRQRLLQSERGFEILAAVPGELSKNNLLQRLFRPNHAVRSLFRTIEAMVGRRTIAGKLLACVSAYRIAAGLGAIPGVALLLNARNVPLGVLFATPLIVAGSILAVAIAFGSDFLKGVKANGFGLVTGVSDDDPAAPALTTWLEQKLRDAAGLNTANIPLTFAMLWDRNCDGATGLRAAPNERDVNLEMITTNLTYGRPLKYPFDTTSLFFHEGEMRRFFPAHVVDWMKQHARGATDGSESTRLAAYAKDDIYPMPPIGDVPVIVATRMSLAFPILFSAVPLRCADFSLKKNNTPAGVPHFLEPCWFSDGGLSSNFPISLFDAPLPRWPTFAINLGAFSEDYPESKDESDNVYMPKRNADGRLPVFQRFTNVPQFLATIFTTVQNWNDNAQMTLPGYRDRIVTVLLSSAEGGLNLDMPLDLLDRLRSRGAAAGTLLAQRYADATLLPNTGAVGWANHRWLRLRSFMGSLRVFLSSLAAGYTRYGAAGYNAMIGSHVNTGPYPISSATSSQAQGLLGDSSTLGTSYAAASGLVVDLPLPPPDLVLRPNLSNLR